MRDIDIVTLVNPNLTLQYSDPMTTGIVYMPVGLAYFAAVLRGAGFRCQVLDAFGEDPSHGWREGDFFLRGLTPAQAADRIHPESRVIVLYAINLMYHRSLIGIVRAVRQRFLHVPIVVLENSQAVTAYSLRRVQSEFYAAGANYTVTGDSEERGLELVRALSEGKAIESLSHVDGIGFCENGATRYTQPVRRVANLDMLPFPAWDLFPLEKYWRLRYAHGPLTHDRYLPLLTSRGCPYSCRFCVIPETSGLKWRGRSAKNVVDEIAYYVERFGVTEFHVEDVDPTVNDRRTRDISQAIIDRGLQVSWKLCAGTKVETLKSEETIALMARAGCRYISVSPESGSPRIMELMQKPFDLEHAIHLIRAMHTHDIRSQACFVLGYPGEDDVDRELTRKMAHALTRAGVDEIAIFIVTPVPGSAIFEQFSGYSDYSQLSFSPAWRSDYEKLNRFRLSLYLDFLRWKARYHPLKLARQPFNFLRRRFETKMEMTPYRAFHTAMLMRRARLAA